MLYDLNREGEYETIDISGVRVYVGLVSDEEMGSLIDADYNGRCAMLPGLLSKWNDESITPIIGEITKSEIIDILSLIISTYESRTSI